MINIKEAIGRLERIAFYSKDNSLIRLNALDALQYLGINGIKRLSDKQMEKVSKYANSLVEETD
jgi:hypothetical protein